MRVLDCTDTSQWQSVLDRCLAYDFYHLPRYTALDAHSYGEGKLFVYEEADAIAAIPLLLRPLWTLEGLPIAFFGYFDATSVYGYSGPVTNQNYTNQGFFERFGKALQAQLNELRVIAAFSRLHPIINNENGLCVGDVLSLGESVSINLMLSLDEQFRHFRKSHRYEIRKARAEKITVVHDTQWKHYNEFIAMYLETMDRVNADKYYYFDENYFARLRLALGNRLHLFAGIHNGKVISAALFTIVNNIVEYHLSGSSSEEKSFAASKLVIDEARQWASNEGATVFHLGGGVSSQADKLFLFKSGFSPNRHTFKIWRYISDSQKYSAAVQHRRAWLLEQGLDYSKVDFFPLYRSPVIPIR